MRVVIATNAQMGASGIGQNRFLETDFCWGLCLSSGLSIPQRPIFGSALRVKEVREKGIVSRNTGAINALLKGVQGNGLVVEKEFEFKPSFDDYLKVMDSVKSNREKKPTASANRIKTRRDLRDQKIASRTREEGQLGDLHGNSSSGRSKLAEQDQLYLSAAGVNLQKGPKCKKVGPKFQGKDKLKDSQSNGFEKKDELDGQGSKMNANVRKKLLPVTPNGILVNKQGRVQAISRMKCFREEKLGHISTEMGGGVEKDHKRGEKVTDRNAALKNMKFNSSSKIIADDTIDNDLKLDRAAFKSLEEFNDICDKPRVSRVDMEERIQKLAKCLNGADIDMPEWMFSKMMRSAKIRFSDHSMLRIIQILGKLGNWRRVLQVVEWIQSRQRFKSHRIRFIYTAALNALGKARRPVEALNLFCAMQQHMSSYPDLVAYHCVAVTLGQAGHMKELFDVIDSMRSPPKKKFKTGVLEKWDPRLEPDVVVYNSVLSACVRRKKWEGAFWVLQQLKQQGLQPSSTTHELVMEVMFVCGKYNLVHDFFKRVQKSSIPNALIYKVIVNTLWREGKTDEAVKAVKDMEKRGIIGSAGLYYDLARCLCSAGRCEEALMQINKICRVANKPLVVAYTGLMQACLDTGHVQNGAYIFNHMQKFCSPNLVTCNILLKAYLDHNMFEEAKELFHELLENGNQISSKSDYRDKVIPDIFTFKLMLDGWFKEQRWDDLEFVYIQMLQYGHPFNAKRHLRMIVEACQAGKRELLETIWRHLAETDRAAPPLLIMERFCMRLEQNDYAGALSCLSNLSLVESPQFSVKSWLRLLSENVHRFPNDTLIRLVDEAGGLLARSNSPNLELKSLIKFCRQFLRNGVTFAEIDQTETFSSSDCETALIS